MAEEKTKDQLLEKSYYKAEIGIGPRRPYKKIRKHDEEVNEEIGKGTYVIIAIHESRDVKGYMLAVVVDIDDNESWWSLSTTFIVEIIGVSSDSMLEEISHLRTAIYEPKYHSWGNKRSIVEIGKKNWDKYQINPATPDIFGE